MGYSPRLGHPEEGAVEGEQATSPQSNLPALGLARAYVMQGDKAKARAAHQDFLALWEHGDPEIPVLNQARSEFARLQ